MLNISSSLPITYMDGESFTIIYNLPQALVVAWLNYYILGHLYPALLTELWGKHACAYLAS